LLYRKAYPKILIKSSKLIFHTGKTEDIFAELAIRKEETLIGRGKFPDLQNSNLFAE
jgi:hypothetical protein